MDAVGDSLGNRNEMHEEIALTSSNLSNEPLFSLN